MKFFPLASNTMTNLYTGYAAECWAFPLGSLKGKATHFGKYIGAPVFFLFEKCFRMPSILLGRPQTDHYDNLVVIPSGSIWQGEWSGLFPIKPLVRPNVCVTYEEFFEITHLDPVKALLNGRNHCAFDMPEEAYRKLISLFFERS